MTIYRPKLVAPVSLPPGRPEPFLDGAAAGSGSGLLYMITYPPDGSVTEVGQRDIKLRLLPCSGNPLQTYDYLSPHLKSIVLADCIWRSGGTVSDIYM